MICSPDHQFVWFLVRLGANSQADQRTCRRLSFAATSRGCLRSCPSWVRDCEQLRVLVSRLWRRLGCTALTRESCRKSGRKQDCRWLLLTPPRVRAHEHVLDNLVNFRQSTPTWPRSSPVLRSVYLTAIALLSKSCFPSDRFLVSPLIFIWYRLPSSGSTEVQDWRVSSHRQALRVFILCNEYAKVSLAFVFFVLTSDLNLKSFITSRQCEEVQVSAQRKLESVQESENIHPSIHP